MTTYEILEKGLALIEAHWAQGVAVRYDVGHVRACCTHGALQVADPSWNGDDDVPAWRALISACSDGSPISFNESPGRKKSEVVEMWQRAIRAEKEKAGIPFDLPEPVVTSPEKAEVHA